MNPREKIQKFIDENRYTYTVDEIVDEYKNKFGKFYVSHTMTHCCESLKGEIEELLKEDKDGAE